MVVKAFHKTYSSVSQTDKVVTLVTDHALFHSTFNVIVHSSSLLIPMCSVISFISIYIRYIVSSNLHNDVAVLFL